MLNLYSQYLQFANLQLVAFRRETMYSVSVSVSCIYFLIFQENRQNGISRARAKNCPTLFPYNDFQSIKKYLHVPNSMRIEYLHLFVYPREQIRQLFLEKVVPHNILSWELFLLLAGRAKTGCRSNTVIRCYRNLLSLSFVTDIFATL